MHEKLRKFMFYDVLIIACRYTFETCHPQIINRRKEIELQITTVAKWRQDSLSEARLKWLINQKMAKCEQCNALFNMMFVTDHVDEKVELKNEVTKAAKSVTGYFSKGVDHRELKLNHPSTDIFTSSHIYSALKITDRWRNFKKA